MVGRSRIGRKHAYDFRCGDNEQQPDSAKKYHIVERCNPYSVFRLISRRTSHAQPMWLRSLGYTSNLASRPEVLYEPVTTLGLFPTLAQLDFRITLGESLQLASVGQTGLDR